MVALDRIVRDAHAEPVGGVREALREHLRGALLAKVDDAGTHPQRDVRGAQRFELRAPEMRHARAEQTGMRPGPRPPRAWPLPPRRSNSNANCRPISV